MSARACNQCYFHVHDLCALARTEPCSTFRLAQREGLVPPPQARLIERPVAEPPVAQTNREQQRHEPRTTYGNALRSLA